MLVDLTPGGAAGAAARRQGLRARPGRGRRSRTSSGSTTSRRCASSCCASSPRTSRRAATTSRARPAQPAGGRRADPRARHARAALAADPAPRLPLRAAARLGDRRALGAPPRAASSARQETVSLAALRRLASILGAHFIEVEGDNLPDDGQARSSPSAARPTSSSARPTSRAAPRSCAARSSRSSCASCPGSTSASSPTGRCARRPSGDGRS